MMTVLPFQVSEDTIQFDWISNKSNANYSYITVDLCICTSIFSHKRELFNI